MQGTRTGTVKPANQRAVGETAQMLGALLRYLFRFDRGAQLRAIEESGLTLTQTKALLELSAPAAGVGSCPGRELAERVGLSEATISRAVDGLAEHGLVTRIEDPGDRRVRLIAITPAGEDAVGRIVSARMGGLREFSASLGAGERRKLDAALAELLGREDLAAAYRRLKEIEQP
jgi:DNA-binding MarR family transcriptional regulator